MAQAVGTSNGGAASRVNHHGRNAFRFPWYTATRPLSSGCRLRSKSSFGSIVRYFVNDVVPSRRRADFYVEGRFFLLVFRFGLLATFHFFL